MKYLVVGLGNPGDKYVKTRHNIGFDIIDWLAETWAVSSFSESGQANALTSEVFVANQKVLLVKPETFMNNSGEEVQTLATYFDIKPENILVIYDDVDLPLSCLRFASSRGSGGHRGVQSVISQIGSEFARLRVGISPTDADGNVEKQTVPEKGINPFVMGKFNTSERSKIKDRFEDIQLAIEKWIESGEVAAMNLIN
jgi:PTH1 family peptidyl-tRNA hydrolase